MLKVKKKIHKTKLKKSQDNEILKHQNDLKNSIKNLFISNQAKKKTIDEYAQLTTKISEEYAKLQQENNQLKIELHKYKNYVEQLPQKSYQKAYPRPIRKRKYYHDLEHEKEDSDESDSYITEIRRRKRKKPRKRIFYEEEIDGVSDQEPDSPPSEEEQDIKPEIKSQLKTNKQPKKIEKGITKSIKM